MIDYWNHNTAYYPELIAAVPSRDSNVLDIGCGDGLLLQKLAPRTERVTGIDTDASAVSQAQARLADRPNAHVFLGGFLTSQELDGQRFDLITCVATLHHMPLGFAIEGIRELLNPGGQLRVVGLSANKTARDWIISGVLLLPIRLMSKLHHESGYPGMTITLSSESVVDIRTAAAMVLPGSHVRRRFYYRYTLTWTKPTSA